MRVTGRRSRRVVASTCRSGSASTRAARAAGSPARGLYGHGELYADECELVEWVDVGVRVPGCGGTCLPINIAVQGSGVSVAAANPTSINFWGGSDQHDGEPRCDDHGGCGLQRGDRVRLRDQRAVLIRLRDVWGAGGTGRGTCTVHERYKPTATTASSGTTTVFECPVAGGSCLPIPFTEQGSGVSAASADPSSLDFGSVPINTASTKSVTITADSGYTISLASGGGINPPFSFGFGTCSGFSGPGTCSVQETFTPTAVVSGERHAERVRVPDRRRLLHPDSGFAHGERRERRGGEPGEHRLRQRADQHERSRPGDGDGRFGLQRSLGFGWRDQSAVLVRLRHVQRFQWPGDVLGAGDVHADGGGAGRAAP